MSTLRQARLSDNRCPNCDAPLIAGARGGMAQNFYCSERSWCRHGYNITHYAGLIVFEQDIGEVEDATFAMYARKP